MLVGMSAWVCEIARMYFVKKIRRLIDFLQLRSLGPVGAQPQRKNLGGKGLFGVFASGVRTLVFQSGGCVNWIFPGTPWSK